MRSEFEKNVIHKQIIDRVRFSEKANQYLPIDASSGVDRGCADVVNVGWISYQYQQSKVDELTKQRDSFIKAYEIEIDKSVELQKRVDFILKVVQSMRNEVKHGHMSGDESQTLSSYANDLEQALKGGSDE